MQAMIFQKVPTQDGTNLATDVWLPDGPGPWPVVFERTCYHRQQQTGLKNKFYTDRDYAYVIQDTRGKYDSEGLFRALDNEAEDGQFSLDWIANQSWCNGRIGMVGRSYHGIVQIPAAAGGHEALRCISPAVAPNSFFVDWIRYDGCFALANMIRWSMEHNTCPTRPTSSHFKWESLWKAGALGTLKDVETLAGFSSQQLRKWVQHDHYDEYWAAVDQAPLYAKVGCPGLHQAGFFDHISRGQFHSFREISRKGATLKARSNQHLVVGPWGHIHCGSEYGDWQFGSAAEVNFADYEQRFLDLWLKEIDDGFSEEPPVKYFLMGDNRWEHATDWPPPGVQIQNWYLGSRGGAQGLGGTGYLSRENPSEAEVDRYVYDPHDPVPTVGGPAYWGMTKVGPRDQRPILNRADVLYYRSECLTASVKVVGEIKLDLWIRSSAPDTDFIAKLCVVDHLGQITVLTFGSLRCRYRESWSEPEPLDCGEPTKLRLQMNNVAYTFPVGSRIALIITSSSYPRILPHRNTMAPTWLETKAQKAKQEILHIQGLESCLLLPVLES